jgi:hypothetical protein
LRMTLCNLVLGQKPTSAPMKHLGGLSSLPENLTSSL